MTDDDLRRIEATLGISLPESYKRHVGQFPVPYLRGNHDTELWDDAEELIDRNLELRHEVHPRAFSLAATKADGIDPEREPLDD